MSRVEVAAFYQFIHLPQFRTLQAPLRALCQEHGVKGTLLLAEEGFNGTLAGPPEGLAAVRAAIGAITGTGAFPARISYAESMPFLRLKVRLKAEIVTLGTPVDPTKQVGTYVEPEDWNALISDPDTVVVDTRNGFEVALGSFAGALDPQTASFGEFPAFARRALRPDGQKKIAMFCTGGIRCEKATSLLLQEGFDEVYHLKGGILNYLERVAPENSLWQGACFVFDQRVAVGHGLAVADDVEACFGCRHPLTADDRLSPDYEEGVCCARCAATTSPEHKASSRERAKQVKLARARGYDHLG
jgi:UPF0176 protein